MSEPKREPKPPRPLPESESREKEPFDVGIAQEPDPGHTVCEDAYTADPEHGFFAVYDGAGGITGARAAAELARAMVTQYLDKNLTDDITDIKAIRQIIEQAVYFSDGHIIDDLTEGATTATVVIIRKLGDKTIAICASVGDSRFYVKKQSSELLQVSVDDNYLTQLDIAGKPITLAEINRLNRLFSTIRSVDELDSEKKYVLDDNKFSERTLYKMLNLTSVLGGQEANEVHIVTKVLEAGDTLVLCTDGISDLVPHNDLAAGINPDDSAQVNADRLLQLSKDGLRIGPNNKTEDDRTVIVIKGKNQTK
ncbi:MAG: protein phosphatase 2C domain-containing protein [Patescibacteria group bacterium]